jgi:predicted transcriptional regulator
MPGLTTPYIDVLPPLSQEEQSSLRLSIEHGGVREPVLATEDMRLLDGHHRYRFCPDVEVCIVAGSGGWTDAQCEAFVIKSNLDRRNLSSDQRKAIRERQRGIARSLRSEGWTQPDVAKLLGVCHKTVDVWESGTNCNVTIGSAPDCRVKVPGKEYQRIADRVAAGESVVQVAADYKVTERGLRKILQKHEARTSQDAGCDVSD